MSLEIILPKWVKIKQAISSHSSHQEISRMTSPLDLGTVAHAVMGSTFKRADRFRDALMESFRTDRKSLDPEDIHQMRVSLRQLRSCLQIFRPHIRLEKAAQEPMVKAFAQSLGAVRDLDVLQDKLQTQYLPALPDAEQNQLQNISHHLQRKRSQYLDTLERKLRSDRYQQFKTAYRTWLKAPQFKGNAHHSFTFLAPDLLLIGLSEWLQHPGWFVATIIVTSIAEGETYRPIPMESLEIETLRSQETEFHALRKCIKQFRYQLVLLSPFLEESSAASLTALGGENIVSSLKTFQEILGNLQDLAVIRELVNTFLDRKRLPKTTLKVALQRLDQDYLSLWQQWQPIQAEYLSPAFRLELRQRVARI